MKMAAATVNAIFPHTISRSLSSRSSISGFAVHSFKRSVNYPPVREILPQYTSFARHKSNKKNKKTKDLSRNQSSKFDEVQSTTSLVSVSQNNVSNSDGTKAGQTSTPSPKRETVLQACILTSAILIALGLFIRQVSHIAFSEGWNIPDCSAEVTYSFDWWHLELVIGLVMSVSSLRYLLLKSWADFLESSEAANQQVLAPLEPWDYAVVAILPGISEELLFRGALLPLFGLDWKGALAVSAIFGVLHLGNGRRSSFAVWAMLVGFMYGMATILSSSIFVPMASHSLNNLIGGIFWRYDSMHRKDSLQR